MKGAVRIISARQANSREVEQDKGHPHLEEGKTKIRDTHFLKGLKQVKDKGHPYLEESSYTVLAPWPAGDPP
ncbi:MAG: hypothetical protein M0Q87_04960 [Ottowia sp.]|nr:hypothetical protein [Ottowia sp.]